jgi:hypothetical protein
VQGGLKRTVKCKCSFLEIYNETLTDLLSPLAGQHLQIREDASHGIYVENLCEEAVGSSERPAHNLPQNLTRILLHKGLLWVPQTHRLLARILLLIYAIGWSAQCKRQRSPLREHCLQYSTGTW